MKTTAAIIAGTLLLMPGCSPIKRADYSGFINIGPEGMPKGWEFEFSPLQADSTLDTSIEYDLIVAVRYSNSYPSRSVIFNIEEISLEKEFPDSLTVEVPLFDEEGRPLGQGRYGVIEVTDTIRRGVRLSEGYTLSLSTPLPSSSTKGIKAVGILMADKNRDTDFLWNLKKQLKL